MIQVHQPLAIGTYYDGAGRIDHHNKLRASELRVDRALATKDWSKRCNFGIHTFWMPMVLEDLRDGTSDYSFCKLADEMIDNTIGVCTSKRSHKVAPVVAGPPRLRQTLRKKDKITG